jgi:hypothetical protein
MVLIADSGTSAIGATPPLPRNPATVPSPSPCGLAHHALPTDSLKSDPGKPPESKLDEGEGHDTWVAEYNERRPHQGRWCFGKTPMQTFLDALPLAKEKLMAA